MRAIAIGAGLLSCCYAVAAAAHHGNTEYDPRVELRYEGVVLRE